MGDVAKPAANEISPMDIGAAVKDATEPVAESCVTKEESKSAIETNTPVRNETTASPSLPKDEKMSIGEVAAEKVAEAKRSLLDPEKGMVAPPINTEAAAAGSETSSAHPITLQIPGTPKESKEEKALKRREKALAKLQAQLAAEPEPRVRSCRNAAKIAQTKIAESAKILNSNKMEEEDEDEKPAPSTAFVKSPKGLKTHSQLHHYGQPSTSSAHPIPHSATLSHHHKGVSILARTPASSGSSHVPLPKMPVLVFKPLAQPGQPGRSQPSVQILTTKSGVKLTGISQTHPRLIMTKPGVRPGLAGTGIKPNVGGSKLMVSGARPPGTGTKLVVSGVKQGGTGTKLVVSGAGTKPTLLKPVGVKPATTVKGAAPVSLKRVSNGSGVAKSRTNGENEPGLAMECEDDDLSPIQWSTYKKAENDYLACLRKLTRLNSQPEVNIVHLGADDPIPSVPRFIGVQEASRLPPPVATTKSGDAAPTAVGDSATTAVTVTPTPPKTRPLGSVLKFATPQALSNQQRASVAARGSSSAPSNTSKPGPSQGSTSVGVSLARQTSPKVYSTTYPELEVMFCPQNLCSSATKLASRTSLDNYLKSLLASSAPNLEKWMLEKGLFGATRFCLFHSNVQMKLMYMSCIKTSETQRKSGYKWWCPNCKVMVPVVQGSFFARWKDNSYAEVLEQVQRWSCNDLEPDRQLLTRKGPGDLRHSVFAALRSVCNSQSAHWQLGGSGHVVEVAIVNIGACLDASDVRIFCAYDRTSRFLKVGAGSKGIIFDERLSELFKNGVFTDSKIVGERQLMPRLPSHFLDSFVVSSSCENLNASGYLRDTVVPTLIRHLPRLEQGVLQSLLDELSWREKFGRIPQTAFTHILTHIKMTYLCSVVSTQGGNSMPIATSAAAKITEAAKTVSAGIGNQKISLPIPMVVSCKSNAKPLPVASATSSLRTVPEVIDLESDSTSSDSVDEISCLTSPVARKRKHPDGRMLSAKRPDIKNLLAANGSSGVPLGKKKKPLSVGEVALASYYYATLQGKTTVQSETEKKKLKFRCPACKKVIEDNTKMMRHLYGHIDDIKQFNMDLSDLTQCKLCFREFPSPFAVQSHMEVVHVKEPVTPVCRICDKEFPKKHLLLKHMRLNHLPSEMPYRCKVCNFCTSFYRDAIEHFHQAHDQSDKLLCQYCLQVFTIRVNQGAQEGIAFYRHLYKHQTRSHNRRCQKCCLAFVLRSELVAHKKAEHLSMKNVHGVKPYIPEKGHKVLMVNPLELVKQKMVTTKDAQSPRAVQTAREMKCVECHMSLYHHDHFTKNIRCSLCRFETNCTRSFANHAISNHSDVKKAGSVTERSLVDPVLCLCGYTSYYGDKMARHLNGCSRKWCYLDDPFSGEELLGTCEQAEEQTSDGEYVVAEACMELDDEGTPMPPENDDKHNMLNILGLMRVAPNVRQRLNPAIKEVLNDIVNGASKSEPTPTGGDDISPQVKKISTSDVNSTLSEIVEPSAQLDIQPASGNRLDMETPLRVFSSALPGSQTLQENDEPILSEKQLPLVIPEPVVDVAVRAENIKQASLDGELSTPGVNLSLLKDKDNDDKIQTDVCLSLTDTITSPSGLPRPVGDDAAAPLDIQLPVAEDSTSSLDILLSAGKSNTALSNVQISGGQNVAAPMNIQLSDVESYSAPQGVVSPASNVTIASANICVSDTGSKADALDTPFPENCISSAPLVNHSPMDESKSVSRNFQIAVDGAPVPLDIQSLESDVAIAPMDLDTATQEIKFPVADLDTASLDIQLVTSDSDVVPMDIELPIDDVDGIALETILPESG